MNIYAQCFKTLGPSSFSVWAKKVATCRTHHIVLLLHMDDAQKELNFKSKFKTLKFSFPSSVLNAQPLYPSKTSLQFSLSLFCSSFSFSLSLSLPGNQSIDPSRVSVLYICLKLIHSPLYFCWGVEICFADLLNKLRSLDCCTAAAAWEPVGNYFRIRADQILMRDSVSQCNV